MDWNGWLANPSPSYYPLDETPSDVAPHVDRKGQPVVAGDQVSFKLHPRGTEQGIAHVSRRGHVIGRGGVDLGRALVIVTDDGTVYSFNEGGVRKLR